jgi:transposase
MKAYSKDLRQKIVDAIRRGMPKAEAARTFGVGISTLKRYATKAQRGEPLEPAKAPGKQPTADFSVIGPYRMMATDGLTEQTTRSIVHA